MKYMIFFMSAVFLAQPFAAAAPTTAAKKAKIDEVNLTIKVNEIIKTQESILNQLQEIKKELEIVKIRATR